MPVPTPPPNPAQFNPAQFNPAQFRPVQPGPPEVDPQPDVLDEVRARLGALDNRPLHEHPEQFTAIDRLLRSALDGSDRAGSR